MHCALKNWNASISNNIIILGFQWILIIFKYFELLERVALARLVYLKIYILSRWIYSSIFFLFEYFNVSFIDYLCSSNNKKTKQNKMSWNGKINRKMFLSTNKWQQCGRDSRCDGGWFFFFRIKKVLRSNWFQSRINNNDRIEWILLNCIHVFVIKSKYENKLNFIIKSVYILSFNFQSSFHWMNNTHGICTHFAILLNIIEFWISTVTLLWTFFLWYLCL